MSEADEAALLSYYRMFADDGTFNISAFKNIFLNYFQIMLPYTSTKQLNYIYEITKLYNLQN